MIQVCVDAPWVQDERHLNVARAWPPPCFFFPFNWRLRNFMRVWQNSRIFSHPGLSTTAPILERRTLCPLLPLTSSNLRNALELIVLVQDSTRISHNQTQISPPLLLTLSSPPPPTKCQLGHSKWKPKPQMSRRCGNNRSSLCRLASCRARFSALATSC